VIRLDVDIFIDVFLNASDFVRLEKLEISKVKENI
jgi:hypothetical protein